MSISSTLLEKIQKFQDRLTARNISMVKFSIRRDFKNCLLKNWFSRDPSCPETETFVLSMSEDSNEEFLPFRIGFELLIQ